MDQECPKCGMVSPAEARYCDCGYDFLAQQVDRHRAPKNESTASAFAIFQGFRLGFGGLFCGVLGIGLLAWELSVADPSFWGVLRSALIAVFGFGLLGVVLWLAMKS